MRNETILDSSRVICIETHTRITKITFILFFSNIFLFYSTYLFQKIDLPEHRSHAFDFDYCLEDGRCDEGRKLILENNEVITINKETCIKQGWEWYGSGCYTFNNNVYYKLKPRAYELNKEECLKEGYCWDSQRSFCVSKEIQYCIDNKKECEDKNGTWDKFFKSCNK